MWGALKLQKANPQAVRSADSSASTPASETGGAGEYHSYCVYLSGVRLSPLLLLALSDRVDGQLKEAGTVYSSHSDKWVYLDASVDLVHDA